MSATPALDALVVALRVAFQEHLHGADPVFVPLDEAWDDPPADPAGGGPAPLIPAPAAPGPGTRLLSLDTGADGWPVDLAALAGLLQVDGLHDALPPTVADTAEALRLTWLELDEASGAVTIEVTLAHTTIPLIPRLVDLRDPGLALELDALPVAEAATLSLFGTAAIGGVDVDVAVEVPGLSFGAQLAQPTLLAPLLAAMGLDADAFDDVQVAALRITGVPGELISLAVIIDDVWEPGAGVRLDRVQLTTTTTLGAHGSTSGAIMAAGHIGGAEADDGIDILLTATHDGPGLGWQLGAVAASEEPIPIGDLLDAVAAVVPVPQMLSSAQLRDVGVDHDTRTGSTTAMGVLTLPGLGSTTDPPTLALRASRAAHPDGTSETTLGGTLHVAGLDFEATFASQEDRTLLVGRYHDATGHGLHLKTLLAAVSPDAAAVLGDADPTVHLNDVLLVHEPADVEAGHGSKHLFAFDLGLGLDLSGLGSLPLIGSALPTDQMLRLTFQPLISSKNPDADGPPEAFTSDDLTAINALLPADAPHVPGEPHPGLHLIATLRIGERTEVLVLGGTDPDPASAPTTGSAEDPLGPVKDRLLDPDADPAATAATSTPAPPPPDPHAALAKNPATIVWIDLQTHLGPIHLDRVGLGLDRGALAARLDAALVAGPLTLSLEGLGLTYDMATEHLAFSLDGIGLDFQQEAVSFSGTFLRLRDPDRFVGKAMLRTETFSLGAIGAYQELNHHPSFFLYASLDYPLGGPAFFFVEGLALGFGYNRRLTVPPIAELHSFPLITEVMGAPAVAAGTSPEETARTELESLDHYLTAQLDEYFLAVGLKFNSFEVLHGVAILVVSFGAQLELDLIGELNLRLPQVEGEDDAPALAAVSLFFAARYVPEEGALSAAAEIGPGSYVYVPECHLTGGFAFASWFSGPHDGDFVFTMGGYHRDFVVPAHYPQPATVKRLQLRWQVDDHLTIHGALYFALTSSAAMAGGEQDITWESGPLKAWFTMGLDVLIQWQPYHYTASAHVEIGASVEIDPPIIGTIRITIEAGAELQLWGPEFSGRADVHVSVMGVSVGFSVSFIDTPEGEVPGLEWPAFATAFLPSPEKVCTISATGGLVRTVTDEQGVEWAVVNPKELRLRLESAIPTTALTPAPRHLAQDHRPRSPVGIAPMHLPSVATPTQINVHRDGHPHDVIGDFALHPLAKRFPAAMWGHTHDPAELLNAGALIATGGYELRPATPARAGLTRRIERRALDAHVTVHGLRRERRPDLTYEVDWTQENDNAKEGRRPALREAIAASTTARNDVLRDLGFDPATEVELSEHLVGDLVAASVLVRMQTLAVVPS